MPGLYRPAPSPGSYSRGGRPAAPQRPARLRIDTQALARPMDEPETLEGSWTLSYLDVLLLLVTLFAVLLGITWMQAGGHPARSLLPHQVELALTTPPPAPLARLDPTILLAALQTQRPSAPPPAARPTPRPQPTPAVIPAPVLSVAIPSSLAPPPARPSADLERLARRVAGASRGRLELQVDARQIRLAVRDDILFPRGSAELGPAGRGLLDDLVTGLLSEPLEISVEGHSDDLPIATPRFPSNWELSSFRATRVARYLIEQGVPEGRIRVSGYADTHPRVPNDSPEHRAQNRRVDIVLQLPAAPGKQAPQRAPLPLQVPDRGGWAQI